MEWCRLYSRIRHDMALRRAGEPAIVLFVFAMGYCAEEETDGLVADDALPMFALDKPKVGLRAEALVAQGVWERVDGGYRFRNWALLQKELMAAIRKREADRTRIAGKRAAAKEAEQDTHGRRRCRKHQRARGGCPDCKVFDLPAPEWCGNCDGEEPSRRRIILPDGSDGGPCPECHPSAGRAAS